MGLLGQRGKLRLFKGLIASIVSCTPAQLVEDSYVFEGWNIPGESRKREKGTSICCWVPSIGLASDGIFDVLQSGLPRFVIIDAVLTICEDIHQAVIRSFVHSISFNPHTNALRKILLSSFYKGGSGSLKRLNQSYTANEWKNLGPTLCSVCWATLCSSPSSTPTPGPESTDGIFRFCSVLMEGMLDMEAGGRSICKNALTLLDFYPQIVSLFFLAGEKA